MKEGSDSYKSAVRLLHEFLNTVPFEERITTKLWISSKLIEDAGYECAQLLSGHKVASLMLLAANIEREADAISQKIKQGKSHEVH